MPVNPAFVMQGRTDHPALLFRMMLAGLASQPQAAGATSPVGGVNPYFGDSLVVTGLGSMNVTVGTGLVYIPSSTAWNGMYAGHNDSAFNIAIPAASSTQWRRDYIAAVVTDPGDNTANWNLINVEGAFSSSSPGSLPALPNNSVPIAIVNVVPNMTVTNGAGTITDARKWQPLAGVLTTTSSAIPSAAPNGTMWYETDTQNFGVIINGQVKYITAGVSYVSTSSTSFINGWAGSIFLYKHADGWVDCIGSTNGAWGTDDAQIFNAIPAGYQPGTSDVSFPATIYINNPPAQAPIWMRAVSAVVEIHNTTAQARSPDSIRWQGRWLATA